MSTFEILKLMEVQEEHMDVQEETVLIKGVVCWALA